MCGFRQTNPLTLPALILGQHAGSELAVTLCGINLAPVNAARTAMWLYATSRSQLTVDAVALALSRFVAKLHLAPIPICAAAMALAHWYVPLVSFCTPPYRLFFHNA
jgi:hypothetical protein